jgi:hypothetical protein
LFAFALAIFVAAPALGAPTVRLAGDATVDAYGTWWFQWWVAHAFESGISPFQTDMLFYPWGKDILTHTGGNLLDVAALLPVRHLFGAVFAWNLLVVAAVATNALAAGAWARRAGNGLAGVLAVETLVGLNPFVLNELHHGRPTQAILAPLLVALAAGDDAFQRGDRRSTVVAAVCLALAGWIYWYAAGFAALALCLLAVGRPFGRRAATLAGIGLGSLLLTLPMVLPLAGALANGEVPGLLPVGHWLAGVPDYTNAQGGTVLISSLARDGWAGFSGASGWLPEGVAVGGLGLLVLLAAPPRWIAVALLGLAIAGGPFPGGVRNPVYLGLMATLPPFERLYWPVRAVSVLLAASTIGAATGLARIPTRLRTGAAVLLALAAVAEAWGRGSLPLGAWEPDVPDVVRCIAASDGAGIVLPYGYDQEALVWQTALQRPMLNGMAERSESLVPPEQQAFRADNTWVRAVLRAPADPRAALDWTAEDKAAVYALGYRWVVLRPATLVEQGSRASPRGRLRDTMRALEGPLGAPLVATDDAVIYAPWGGLDGCASR